MRSRNAVHGDEDADPALARTLDRPDPTDPTHQMQAQMQALLRGLRALKKDTCDGLVQTDAELVQLLQDFPCLRFEEPEEGGWCDSDTSPFPPVDSFPPVDDPTSEPNKEDSRQTREGARAETAEAAEAAEETETAEESEEEAAEEAAEETETAGAEERALEESFEELEADFDSSTF
ncbi:hypothetical protein B484DRAFT_457527 [Ochromonadaceae sp. CCMP2298]|nr:hypothetical protein B484DRAFT_457527 [Ochromonadaceae sp. CCMP2298]